MTGEEAAFRGARMGLSAVTGKPIARPSGVVSMAILFGAVKKQVEAQKLMEQRAFAAREEGERSYAREGVAREQNLDRMRQQTKSQLALSMGVDPFAMSSGSTSAYIARSAASQNPGPLGGRMGLGMV